MKKKTKPASKKNDPVKFASEETESDQFEKLMDRSGVGVLTKKTGPHKEKQKPIKHKSNDSVEFRNDLDWPGEIAKKSLRGKFAGKPKRPKKQPPTKKVPKDFQPDATLDLHGETQNRALTRAERFIQNSKARGCRSVLIITGRGINSAGNKGVLKTVIWEWLKNQRNKNLIRFQIAPDFLGGEGAVLVFI